MSWGKMFTVATVCFLKLIIAGIPTAAGLDLNFWETFIAAFSGGTVGVVFFVLLIDQIIALYNRLVPKRKSKKVFSRKKRLIVKAKQRFGLTGIAILTPSLLSMPLGAFLAVRFFHDKAKIIRYMILSVLFWSLFGALLAQPIKAFKDYLIALL